MHIHRTYRYRYISIFIFEIYSSTLPALTTLAVSAEALCWRGRVGAGHLRWEFLYKVPGSNWAARAGTVHPYGPYTIEGSLSFPYPPFQEKRLFIDGLKVGGVAGMGPLWPDWLDGRTG